MCWKIYRYAIRIVLELLSKDSHINNYTVLQGAVNIFVKYVGMLHQNCTVLPLWDFPSSRIFELCARNQLWGSHTHFVAGNFFCEWFQFAIGLELRQYTTRPCWIFFQIFVKKIWNLCCDMIGSKTWSVSAVIQYEIAQCLGFYGKLIFLFVCRESNYSVEYPVEKPCRSIR